MYKNSVGMIGLGSWGKNIYRNLETLNVLKKIYDSNTEQLNNTVTSKKQIANNADEIILSKDIDSIVISSPADTHKNYIIKSLLNNKNVFVEKPLCLSLKDAIEIKKLSLEVNKIFFVGHLLHYHNGFNELKNIIKLGKIGNLQIIKANRLNFGVIRQKESVLFDLASHDISMILSISEAMPKKVEVNAIFNNSKKIADYINVLLYFENGLTAVINSDWISPYKEHRFSVLGSKGSLVFDDTKDWPNKLIINPSYLNKEKKIIYKPEKAIEVSNEEPLKKEIETFLQCVKKNHKPITDIDEAINVQVVLDMIEKELRENYG
jgi:UDP-2-acetamido-3-amino-2,3-dideoxy-glucuronate N-acetyltransferase